ncbi:uncharacterized protein VTP21DRAFT_1159 [Calcarisporiella thermophila]|uniref:uncharacterized protein n=1 Tax=Calcarisporiella thermophila TaxID=911321 RepID=UPI003742E5C0
MRALNKFPPENRIHVRNVPMSVSDRRLRSVFLQFGPVLEMRVERDNEMEGIYKHAYVTFANVASVERALNTELKIEGIDLETSIAAPRQHRHRTLSMSTLSSLTESVSVNSRPDMSTQCFPPAHHAYAWGTPPPTAAVGTVPGYWYGDQQPYPTHPCPPFPFLCQCGYPLPPVVVPAYFYYPPNACAPQACGLPQHGDASNSAITQHPLANSPSMAMNEEASGSIFNPE